MLNFLPKYFTSKAILLYFFTLIAVSLLFSNSLQIQFVIIGSIQVVGFFYFSNLLTQKWAEIPQNIFVKYIFYTALIIRLLWAIISYYLYIYWTGIPFEWISGDAYAYHNLAQWFSALLKEGLSLKPYFDNFEGTYSDTGYPTYLGVIYYIFGDSILVARLFKALFGAITVFFIYKLATRTFGESTGRMAGIFAMLMPNLIHYTGLHLKEVEMLLMVVLFIDRADELIRGKKFTFNTLWLPLLLSISLFFFRTVLGVAAILALFSALFLSSERSGKISRRIFATVSFSIAIFYFVGSQYFIEIDSVWQQRQTNQAKSMEWRSVRADGFNKYARYASTAVFAPMIFTIPFPTMITVVNQENQMIMNGSNFVKNIIAFFVLYALYSMIIEKKWRDYLLIVTFVVSYLAVIAMSSFAHSERFHQPVLPFYMILAAYGVSKITNKQKKYFNIYIFFVFIAIFGWSWFKLSGRGLI